MKELFREFLSRNHLWDHYRDRPLFSHDAAGDAFKAWWQEHVERIVGEAR